MLASASISPVQAAGGGDPFAFLLLQTDARPASLGGAYAAAVDDANAVFYNPAGLADQRRHNTVFMHNKQFEGINQETAALGFRQGWGIGINYLSVGDIPRTTVSNPGGSGLSSFDSSDLALAGGYGRRVSGSVSLGFSLKYVRSEIDGVSAVGVGLDIGGKMDLEPLI